MGSVMDSHSEVYRMGHIMMLTQKKGLRHALEYWDIGKPEFEAMLRFKPFCRSLRSIATNNDPELDDGNW